MGILNTVRGIRYLKDMVDNKEKKQQFKSVKENTALKTKTAKNKAINADLFETNDIHLLRMEESAGVVGKRSFSVTDETGKELYTAEKVGTVKLPHLKLYDAKDNMVGSVKSKLSYYKPVFILSISGEKYKLKQTSLMESLYELEDKGWQVDFHWGKAIVCDKKWKKIIQIECKESTLKWGKRTEVYEIKMLNRRNEKAAIILALAMYIAHRPEYR